MLSSANQIKTNHSVFQNLSLLSTITWIVWVMRRLFVHVGRRFVVDSWE